MIDLRLADALGRDGLVALADNSVDAVITDPPFDARTHRVALDGPRRGGRRTVSGKLPFGPLAPGEVYVLAWHFVRVCRGFIVVFCGNEQIPIWTHALQTAGAKFHTVGLAVRTNPRPMFDAHLPAHVADPLVIAHRPDARLPSARPIFARWRAPAARWDTDGRNVVPAQKAVALMQALVEDFTSPGDVVCDPFAGSGTTALACKLLGRAFVGFEIDTERHRIALERVAATPEPEAVNGTTEPPATGASIEAPSPPPVDAPTALARAEAPTATEAPTARLCARPGCGQPIAPNARQDSLYCSKSCRNMASRARRRAC